MVEKPKPTLLCNQDCKNCKVIHDRNWVAGYTILARLDMLFSGTKPMVNSVCTNMTVCPSCHMDDFTHVEGCPISKMLDEI